MSTILILGGTGKVGRRVAGVLEGSGHTARPASRSTPIRFDWREPASWAPAMEGADGVFIVGPGSATYWSPLLSTLLTQAQAAGLRRAVLLSARGVEFLPDGNVARAEEALRAGPLPWTILRPTHFAQNFTEAMFVPVNGQITAPTGDGAEPFIDVADVAEVAARVLTADDARGETLVLSGPAALTFTQAARVLSEVSGQRVEFRDETESDHAASLRAAGVPEEYVRWRLAMLGGIRSGADAYLSDGVDRVLGHQGTDFATWARQEVPRTSAKQN